MKQFLIENRSKFPFLDSDIFIKTIIKESKIFDYSEITYNIFFEIYDTLIPFWSEEKIYHLLKNLDVFTHMINNKEKIFELINKKNKINILIGIYYGGYDSLLLIPSLDEVYNSLSFV